jgi:vanillate O-demethylase monooxygenase subunit
MEALMYAEGWYVCASSEEVGRSLIARRILGEPVVIYRSEDGSPVILEDRCAHRRLPLSKGRLIGDRIQCGYHGLEFAPSGACVRIPGQDSVPGKGVKSYRVAEQQGWVFLWMGDCAAVDETPVPSVAKYADAPGWRTVRGLVSIKCNHLLILDNLLDLSHLAYVHGATTGNAAIAENAKVETKVVGDHVRVLRTMEDVEAARFYAEFGGLGRMNRWQLTEYIPPSFILVNNGTEAAASGPITPEKVDGIGSWGLQVYHGVTPETRNTTHEFWQISHPENAFPANRRSEFDELTYKVFSEDIAVYEAQQEALELMGDGGMDGRVNSVITINADAGLNYARRIHHSLSHKSSVR